MKRTQSDLFWAVIGVIFVLSGCSTVTSIQPFGVPFTGDLSAELTGTWMGPEGQQLLVHCDPEGRVAYAVTEWKDQQGAFVLDGGTGSLTSVRDHVFFNGLEDDGSEGYSFVLLRVSDGQMVVWLPDPPAFQELVEGGVLQGRVEEDSNSRSVVLTDSAETIALVMADRDLATLFDWSKPAIVLVRVGN